MRSRYSAYVLGNERYLLETWHPSTRPTELNLRAEQPTKWLGLKIIAVAGDAESNEGTVEFVARCKINGRAFRLHEISYFLREDGVWCYLNGDFKN